MRLMQYVPVLAQPVFADVEIMASTTAIITGETAHLQRLILSSPSQLDTSVTTSCEPSSCVLGDVHELTSSYFVDPAGVDAQPEGNVSLLHWERRKM